MKWQVNMKGLISIESSIMADEVIRGKILALLGLPGCAVRQVERVREVEEPCAIGQADKLGLMGAYGLDRNPRVDFRNFRGRGELVGLVWHQRVTRV